MNRPVTVLYRHVIVARNRFLRSRPVAGLLSFSKKFVLPGFDGVPLYYVSSLFWETMQKGALTLRAAAFSFNFFLALFPGIIFFFTIIPYIPTPGFQDSLLALLKDFIPHRTYAAVESTLFDIIKQPRGGLMSIGFVMALYFSTNGIHSLILAFNQTHHSMENRSWFKQRLIAILLVVILSLVIIVSIVIISVGPVVIDWFVEHGFLRDKFSYYLIISVKWIISSAMLFFAFSFLYYLGPAAQSRFRFISPGSTLSTILTLALTLGFNYYVNNISKYNTLYGSIGTLIVLMLWIYFNAFIVLLGFELNVSIQNAKRKGDFSVVS